MGLLNDIIEQQVQENGEADVHLTDALTLLQDQIIANQGLNAFRVGAGKQLEDYYTEISQMTEEQAKELNLDTEGDNNYKVQASRALEKLKIYERAYNRVGGLRTDHTKAYANLVVSDQLSDSINASKEDC